MSRCVLVTGASRGIGRHIALRLARSGFDVAIHCHRQTEAAEAVAREAIGAGVAARVLRFDIGDRATAAQALGEDVDRHGAYYGVVCNAGVHRDGAFPALDGDAWDDVIRTNLDGFYNVLHPVVMAMVRKRQGGRIVVLSSVSGLVGNRGQVNYSAAKAGLIGAAKALAVELASRRITVNCVVPGIIDTGMAVDIDTEQVLGIIPARRLGQPEEVAGLVAYLVSDEAAYITRQAISINGGMF